MIKEVDMVGLPLSGSSNVQRTDQVPGSPHDLQRHNPAGITPAYEGTCRALWNPPPSYSVSHPTKFHMLTTAPVHDPPHQPSDKS